MKLYLIIHLYCYIQGPNDLWSIDGHDKLATYGIYIHGCLDAFSRRVLWCMTYVTNKNPTVVAKFFADAVRKLQGW